MTLTYFIISQILAHILTDYVFQTDRLAADKDQKGFQSRFLFWHGLLAGFSSWLLYPSPRFIWGALFIALTHYLIDGFKKSLWKAKIIKTYAFFLDQASHLLMLVLAVFIYDKFIPTTPLFYLSEPYLPIIFCVIFVGKPVNILIRELFRVFRIPATAESQELPRGGRMIGTLERWLVLIFIWSGHFEAIGFLIAAKSILRYKDTDTLKTEYVLIGTMLSFGIALILGLLTHFEF